MRYLDEFRDPALARALLRRVDGLVTRPWTIMEVCGGQTHSILRHGIDRLLPEELELVHGPGCPVCVTPVETIDRALAIAERPGVVLCSFGDMLRVPGSRTDLSDARSRGADVRVVYSPLDALRLARDLPDREVVFLAVGFETTAPATAMAAFQARELGVANFSLLVAHVLVPPAIAAILDAPDNRVQGFLAAGHVCTVMGCREYEPLVERFGVPIVVAGFEPVDLLDGICRVVAQLEAGRAELENAYDRVVTMEGSAPARAMLAEVFDVVDRPWRGIGVVPGGGYRLSGGYAALDAERRFPVAHVVSPESTRCRSGEVLRGRIRPDACEAFGADCTPEHPLGAPMVSAEGACAAYYRYRPVDVGSP